MYSHHHSVSLEASIIHLSIWGPSPGSPAHSHSVTLRADLPVLDAVCSESRDLWSLWRSCPQVAVCSVLCSFWRFCTSPAMWGCCHVCSATPIVYVRFFPAHGFRPFGRIFPVVGVDKNVGEEVPDHFLQHLYSVAFPPTAQEGPNPPGPSQYSCL